jgi:hypothetical protein
LFLIVLLFLLEKLINLKKDVINFNNYLLHFHTSYKIFTFVFKNFKFEIVFEFFVGLIVKVFVFLFIKNYKLIKFLKVRVSKINLLKIIYLLLYFGFFIIIATLLFKKFFKFFIINYYFDNIFFLVFFSFAEEMVFICNISIEDRFFKIYFYKKNFNVINFELIGLEVVMGCKLMKKMIKFFWAFIELN